MVRLNKDAEPSVEIVAESRERAHLINLMMIAGDLVDECEKDQ